MGYTEQNKQRNWSEISLEITSKRNVNKKLVLSQPDSGCEYIKSFPLL